MKTNSTSPLVSSWLVKIEEKFLSASDEHIEQGLRWYKDAHDFVTMTGLHYGISTDKVAQIVASLSPGIKWPRNKTDTWLLLSWATLSEEQIKALPFSTYKANVMKAWRVYHDKEQLTEKSKKTYAFYRNIMLDPDYVTVDRHAITAIAGKKFLAKVKGTAAGAYALSEHRYKLAANAYKNMANKYNLTPYQLQAIVWLSEKALKKGITRKKAN